MGTYLPVRAEGEGEVVSAPHPHGADGAVVVLAEQTGARERLLPHLVESLEHARDEVAAHEHLGQLLGVLVLRVPDGIVLRIELLPEVGDGLGFVFVRVTTFEVVHVECTEMIYFFTLVWN